MFIPRAQPHPQSLFLFPIVFGINLIHFFRWEGRCSRKFDRLFRCFDPLSRHLTEAKKNANCFEECNVFTCNGSVNSAPFKRGVRERDAHFWQGKVQDSSPILRCTFWQGKVQNSSPISALLRWRHFRLTLSLSLSLSLCISLSHRAHLTHNIGSASYNMRLQWHAHKTCMKKMHLTKSWFKIMKCDPGAPKIE